MNVARVKTRAGVVETIDAGSGAPAVLLLHGNSGHKEVFARQVEALSPHYRIVVPDLIGHGRSEDASEPGRDYTLGGHAQYLAELVAAMGIGPVVVVGTSLGGHIALELAAQLPDARGLMLVGAPPFAKDTASLTGAWLPGPAIELSGKAEFGEADVERFIAAHAIDSPELAEGLRGAIRRADGRSRTTVVGALLGEQAADQRELVRSAAVPIAVVNGGDDSAVNLEFVEAAPYRRLWRGRAFRIAGAGHMPQASHPGAFNDLLAAFVRDCAG
ncbi:alpha/beta hydrolase [Devosia sp. LjRoot16]|uniref:alpha/beta fold hydrolase n=1 Tax=Devosia sp. LjRoot16 TaxID=3342271 RepID=UPI003ECE21BC